MPDSTPEDCPFCYNTTKNRVVKAHKSVIAIEDSSPVTSGHLLIIPKRHCIDFFAMTEQEQIDANHLLRSLKEKILSDDPTVSGFNIGINNGTSAGQTVFHCHIHLIPRRDGDTPHPRGGVRGVIPEKMNY